MIEQTTNNFFTKTIFEKKLMMKILMEEFKPVALKKSSFGNRLNKNHNSTLAFLAYQDSNVRNKLDNFQSKSPLKV